MISHELEVFLNGSNVIKQDDEYSDIPIDISDIISICREFTKLTWQMQGQIDSILELGVEESVNTGLVSKSSLPHIKSFLQKVCENPYFGDAVSQAKDCVKLIQNYEDSQIISKKLILN